ncbi:hypothetical protein M409DRAFT_36810 [Zasmidium cellare ATCC 36951]|uniref:Major facilitator superfamily (MFS) profile domain-containing protein n=1 Tax=Zasmidium cellare ATCC 36951 TaxID=1080233 RepID=A0A6A6CGS5_ZASCE|nr:uncharacterized protein M409DRAFT_36810 [Zasmidium cellare ATCC 36951]KAF2165853.1 hypothetical protein M409DRAFT_36810 [Zasmidium cellare ATCC 36951]
MEPSSSEVHYLKSFGSQRETCDEPQHNTQSLPPVGGGRQAWSFLFACFLLEALIWVGFPNSYGVFQVYYSNDALFADDKTGVAAIGTTQIGLLYLALPIVAIVMRQWPKSRRPGMILGACVNVISLLAASFCNSAAGLIVTQGVLYSLSGLCVYFPSAYYIDEWFVRKKGLAYGIMWAGAGSAGVGVPFLLSWLLSRYGFRTTLRVWCVVLTVGLALCLLFVKPRIPISAASANHAPRLSFLGYGFFWLFEAGVILQSFVYFLPTLWLPSFAKDIGLPAFSGNLSLALLSVGNVLGAVFHGFLIDRLHISTVLIICAIGQMIAIFVFWGIATSQATLYVFAIMWGFFGCGFSASWAGYEPAIQKSRRDPNTSVDMTLVMAFAAAGRGPGAIISGPLSEVLLNAGWKSHASLAYGTQYGVLIVFGGIFAGLSGIGGLGKALGRPIHVDRPTS